jgi:hypothetical protein
MYDDDLQNQTKGTNVTIVRVGTTKKYSDGWETAFGKKGGMKAAGKSKSAASAAKKGKKKLAKAGKR